jgi:hypothetical protein
MLRLRFLLVSVVLLACPAYSQRFSWGVKGGVPLTQFFDSTTSRIGGHLSWDQYAGSTRRYSAGAAAELRLNKWIELHADELYRRFGYASSSWSLDSGQGRESWGFSTVKGNVWDTAVLAAHRFPKLHRAFAGGGAVMRAIGPATETGVTGEYSLVDHSSSVRQYKDSPGDLHARLHAGIVASAGIEVMARGRFRVEPEVRYTHWVTNLNPPNGAIRFAPHQVDVLVGFFF